MVDKLQNSKHVPPLAENQEQVTYLTGTKEMSLLKDNKKTVPFLTHKKKVSSKLDMNKSCPQDNLDKVIYYVKCKKSPKYARNY